MLIGDIAGQVKPTTGGGIYFAMRSADLASDIAENALIRNEFSEEFLSAYSKNWDKIFKREMSVGYFARQFYESLDQDDITEIMEYIKESELLSGDLKFDWHSDLILFALKTRIKSYMKNPIKKAFRNLSTRWNY